MAVINDPGLGGLYAQSIGQGLQMLANAKVQQMQKQAAQAKTFQALRSMNAPQEEAYSLSLLPEKLQEKLIPQYIESLSGRGSEQSTQQNSSFDQALSALQGQSAAVPSSEIPSTSARANIVPAQEQQQPALQGPQDFVKKLGVTSPDQALSSIKQPQQTQEVPAAQEATAQQEQIPAKPQGESLGLKSQRTTGKRAKAIPLKEQLAREKSSADYRTEVLEAYKAARSTKFDIGRMQKINRDGDLPDNQFYSVMKEAGYDFLALMRSTDAQEFEKIQTNFLKNMKSIFGARISIQEMEQYIKGIPSLMMTPEGRERIFRNFEIMADIAEERFKTMRQIIKESNGKIPLGTDLAEEVEERMQPYLDKKQEEFIKGMEKPSLKPGDKIDIHKVPAYTVPNVKVIQHGKKWKSNGSKWVEGW